MQIAIVWGMLICHLTLTWGWTNGGSTWTIVKNKLKPYPINITSAVSLIFQQDLPYSYSWSSRYPYHLIWMGMFWNAHHKVPKQICFLRICKSASLGIFCILSTTLHTHYPPFHVYLGSVFSTRHLPRSELLMHFVKLNSSRAQRIQTYRYEGIIYKRSRKQC